MIVATLLLACVVLAGAAFALAVALRRLRRGISEDLAAVRRELAHLQTTTSVDGSRPEPAGALPVVAEEPSDDSSRRARPGTEETPGEDTEFVITRLGQEPDESAPTMEAKLFADVVLRESVVKAASWAHGLRQALSPANRNRIWFEMRREVKRARKDRKAEEREAIREWRARRRAGVRAHEESAA